MVYLGFKEMMEPGNELAYIQKAWVILDHWHKIIKMPLVNTTIRTNNLKAALSAIKNFRIYNEISPLITPKNYVYGMQSYGKGRLYSKKSIWAPLIYQSIFGADKLFWHNPLKSHTPQKGIDFWSLRVSWKWSNSASHLNEVFLYINFLNCF